MSASAQVEASQLHLNRSSVKNSVSGGACDQHQGTPELGEPDEQEPEVVADGGEDGIGGIARLASQIIASHPVVFLEVPYHQFDRSAPPPSPAAGW